MTNILACFNSFFFIFYSFPPDNSGKSEGGAGSESSEGGTSKQIFPKTAYGYTQRGRVFDVFLHSVKFFKGKSSSIENYSLSFPQIWKRRTKTKVNR